MNHLGEYIAEHRTAKNLSIRKLAELAHISHTEIHRLENGERKNPSPFVLKAISTALGESFDEIMKAAGYLDDPNSSVKSAKIIDISDLNEKEIQEVKDFIEFLRNKRSKTK